MSAGGIVSDALIARQTSSSIRRVLAPKNAGTQNLVRMLHGLRQGSLCSFSSVAALVGSKGQANYAAANAAMDAIIACRAASGVAGETGNR